MRLPLLLAALGFSIAPIAGVAAQSPSTQARGGQSGQTGPQQTGQPGTAPAGQPATPPVPQSPSPNAPPPPAGRPETTTETAPLGNAPSVPAGETPAEAALPVPDTGPLSRINVQGNRRVETDAIRAALPLRAGAKFDNASPKPAVRAVWRMGYFNAV